MVRVSPGFELRRECGCLFQLRDTFGPEVLPINLPSGNGKAVVECLLNNSGESDFDKLVKQAGKVWVREGVSKKEVDPKSIDGSSTVLSLK